MFYDRAALKQGCKQTMRAANPKVWLVTLVFLLVVAVVTGLCSALTPNPVAELLGDILDDPYAYEYIDEDELALEFLGYFGRAAGIGTLLGLLSSLFQMVMSYGYAGYALKAYHGQGTYADLFVGFSNIGQVLGTSIMVSIFVALWSVLIAVGGGVAIGLLAGFFGSSGMDGLVTLLILVVLVAVAVGIVCISYRYCLTPYFVVTRRVSGVFEAITASKNAMKGNIGKRFVLDLSFLGWDWLVGAAGSIIGTVGTAIVLAANSGKLSGLAEELDRSRDLEDALATLAYTFGAVGGGIAVVLTIAVLAALPLSLWVSSYKALASAGFYSIVTGEQLPGQEELPPAGTIL